MPFAALDDEFFGHPKTTKAGLDGAGLYARALSYCAHYLTDGFVPDAWVNEVAKPVTRKRVTDAGFWVEVKGGEHYEYMSGVNAYTVDIVEPGYFIPDYLVHLNPTRESVLAKRKELSKKRAEAGKKGAIARWERQGKNDGNRHGKSNGNGDGKTPKQDGKTMATGWPPAPSPKELTKAVPLARPDGPPDDEGTASAKPVGTPALKEAS